MFLITLAPSFGIWRFLNELGKPQRDSRNFLRPAQDIAAAKGPIEWAHDVSVSTRPRLTLFCGWKAC
jgi:hypothetical protein